MRQVVLGLYTRLCSCCGEPTNCFLVLTCTRLCLSCFQTDPSVTMSSLRYYFYVSYPETRISVYEYSIRGIDLDLHVKVMGISCL